MKKTLAALSVLGAFAGSSLAADVTLYGVIDTGLVYQHADADLPDVDTVDTFQMKSGVTAGSRFGLKGTEDLGNGLKIGFVLENGFVSDTGSFTQNNRLFGREAQLNLSGAFGTVAFGRMGRLASGNDTCGLLGSLSPFGTSWGEYAANASTVMSGFDRYDNTVTYATPAFAGFKAYAQYSFDTDSKDDYDGAGLHGVEGKSSVDRYYAIGLTYANGPLNLAAVVDQTNFSTTKWNGVDWGNPVDDALTVTVGGNYDFQVVKLYAGAQYFDNADLNSIDNIFSKDFALSPAQTERFQVKGYGLTIGADIPAAGGTFKVATSYLDGTIDKVNGWDMATAIGATFGEIDISRWNTSAGYLYSLSKRTSLYGVASYSYQTVKGQKDFNGYSLDVAPTVIEVAAGIVHKF